MGSRWIRLDVGWEDSWLDALTGAAAGCWPRLLCWVKRDGVRGRCRRPNLVTLSRRWRVTVSDIEELERAAIDDGALIIEDDEWVVVNWAEYQDHDPTAAERQRRRRGRDTPEPPPSHPVTRDIRDTGRNTVTAVARDVDVDVDTSNGKRTSVSNETGSADFFEPPPDDKPQTVHQQFMPLLRELGYEADETDGSILKQLDAKCDREEIEAAICGLAQMRDAGQLLKPLGIARDSPLSLRILNASRKSKHQDQQWWRQAQQAYWKNQRMNANGMKRATL